MHTRTYVRTVLGITGAMTFYGMTAGLALGVFNAALAFTLQVGIQTMIIITRVSGEEIRIRIRMTRAIRIEMGVRIMLVVKMIVVITLIMIIGINNSNSSTDTHGDSDSTTNWNRRRTHTYIRTYVFMNDWCQQSFFIIFNLSTIDIHSQFSVKYSKVIHLNIVNLSHFIPCLVCLFRVVVTSHQSAQYALRVRYGHLSGVRTARTVY